MLIFRKIRLEEDYETEGLPRVIGETLGCSCCSKRIPITKENLKAHIDALREELILARDTMRAEFDIIDE